MGQMRQMFHQRLWNITSTQWYQNMLFAKHEEDISYYWHGVYSSSFLACRSAASASSYILFFGFRGISSCRFLSSGEMSSTFVSSFSSACFWLSSTIWPTCSTTLSGFEGVAKAVPCSQIASPFPTLAVTYCPWPEPTVGIAMGELLLIAADEES